MSQPMVINLRAACGADDREFALGRALGAVGQELAAGRVVEVVWPVARQAGWAASELGLPLAQSIVAMVTSAPPASAVVIHTRAGSADDFLAFSPTAGLSFVMHLNAEEAALRWERGEASPGRRLAAAVRLRSAGWQIWTCVGPIRLFDGWRVEYADLAERAAAAGIDRLLVSYPGEDVMEPAGPGLAHEGVRPLRDATGCRLTVPPRQRREVQALLNGRLAEVA